LYGVQDDEAKWLGEREKGKIVPGNFSDGENTLRRFSASGRREFGGGDFLHWNSTFSQSREQCLAVREMGRRLHECAADSEWRTQELGDGANAFGNEKAVTLARVTALQVTGYTEHAHATGT
jgi:hypothetical protein